MKTRNRLAIVLFVCAFVFLFYTATGFVEDGDIIVEKYNGVTAE